MSDLNDLQARALEIRQKYADLNKHDNHSSWNAEAYAMGLIGDIGDLLKLVMAKANLRNINGVTDIDERLGHELSDVLWSVLVLSDQYGINLDAAFRQNMDELEVRIRGELS